MIFTAAELDRHIQVLRQLEKDNLADTLAAYVDIVRRVAEQGDAGPGQTGDRVPAGIVEQARRLRGAGTHGGGTV